MGCTNLISLSMVSTPIEKLQRPPEADVVLPGIKQSPVYPMVIKAITKSNALAFFGADIGE